MQLRTHPEYKALTQRAQASHQQNRSPEGITDQDVARARLYCYAFRRHTIGAFHAVREAIEALPPDGPVAEAYRIRATESLRDLGNQSMEAVPEDFRVVISTFHRYHTGVWRVLDSLEHDFAASSDNQVRHIGDSFRQTMEKITGECGIELTLDTEAPELANFVVPNLGIIIVPLVYGEQHSWNLAYLAGENGDVPTHRHHHGVEIHLGYNPTRGMTVLGTHRAEVDEGYAMPIPPETDHGWVNTTEEAHHVPFIFGSMLHAGWGVFLDVETRPTPIEEFTTLVDRQSAPFSAMVHLEREIDRAAAMRQSWRKTLIPFQVTNRQRSGGLELSLTRANATGYTYERDAFRIVSISRGSGIVSIEGIERSVGPHDHFGVPAGMTATLRQTGSDSLVALDALIKTL